MPDAYTSQTAIGSMAQAVWSKAIQWPYRDQLHFDGIADARSTTESGTRGKTVSFIYPADLALATTAIDEVVGPDAVTFTQATQTVALAEYANTMKSTALARTTGWVALDQILANLIGYNAGASIDTIAVTAAVLPTSNIQRANGRATTGAITSTDVLTTAELQIAATELEKANVPTIGGWYNLYAHPYQVFDLRSATGAGTWRQPKENGSDNASALENHTIGYWEGFRIISANREPMTADVGAGSTVDVYKALAVGQGYLGKAYSDHPEAPGATPQVRFGLATDALMRNKPISWYHLVGYKALREAAGRQIFTASSRGANT